MTLSTECTWLRPPNGFALPSVFEQHVMSGGQKAPSNFRLRRLLSAGLLLSWVAFALGARAQGPSVDNRNANHNQLVSLGVNVVIGGATAATHALLRGGNVSRAFATGAFGGAVHFSGKLLAARGTAAAGLSGVVVSSLGTAIVSNASRGVNVLDEVFIPLGPLRTRIASNDSDRVSVSLNGYEAVVAIYSFLEPGLRFDLRRSASAGTLVFITRDRYIVTRGDTVDGLTGGSIAIVSSFAKHPRQTQRHEMAHVQQNWFMQELWGLPLERAIRSRLRYLSRVPNWLDAGVVTPLIVLAEDAIFQAEGPLRRAVETEAEAIATP